MKKKKQKLKPKKNQKNKIQKKEDLIPAINRLTEATNYLIKRTTPRHHFLLGISSGLGTVFGATIILAFILYIFTRLSFVPVIGEFASQIVRIVQSNLSP